MNEMRRVEDEASAQPALRRRWLRPALMLVVPLVLLIAGAWYWSTSGRTISTDNAQVGTHVVNVAPEVTGKVVEVAVRENQAVKAGDLLFKIDPAPYRIALEQAEAAIGNAKLQIAQMQGGYGARVADISERNADVQLAQENFRRQSDLMKRGFTTRASYDAAQAALSAAQAQRASAASEAQSARAMLGSSERGGHPQVEAAIAARDKAALDLSRTEVYSPIDGIVSQTDKLSRGSMAMQMMTALSVVGGDDTWVEANFKETQLVRIRIGQQAEVSFDAMPGKAYKAEVIGIGAGTGSQFSLLPAQNATGNWVKVTQRVPVRLRLLEAPARPLVAGWSADVTVRVAD